MRENIKAKRWSYLAGLVDGDGSISLTEHESPKQIHFFFRVKVCSTQKAQINWLVQQFGGQWSRHIDKREGNRPCYTWFVRGRHAERILAGIEPFLIIKRQAAIKALEYVRIPFKEDNPSLRSKYAAEISALNHFYVPAEDKPWMMVNTKPSALPKEQIAYAAGLLDAEGTFSIPTPTAASPQIQLSNTDNRVMEWFYYRLGGICFSCEKKDRENHRDSGLWRFSGGRSQKIEHLTLVKKSKELFLLAILPYLVQKRKQAILCLSLLRGDRPSEICFAEMAKLNQVGTQTTNTPNTSNDVKIEPDPVGDYGCASLVTALA